MKNTIKSCFPPLQTKPKGALPTEPNVADNGVQENNDSAQEGDNRVVEHVNPASPAAAALSLFDKAKLHFYGTADMEERSAALVGHPLFQDCFNGEPLDAPFMLDILKHMAQTINMHGYTFFRAHHAFDDYDTVVGGLRKKYPNSVLVLEKTKPENFKAWQTRAIKLAIGQPGFSDNLYAAMQENLEKLRKLEVFSPAWLACAENMGYSHSKRGYEHMLDACYAAFRKHLNVEVCISEFPQFHTSWRDAQNDERTKAWALGHLDKSVWLSKHHPHINAWDVAEWCSTEKNISNFTSMLDTLSSNTPSGALLKAWYGVELTLDEMSKHPLAHSLYVHKYAPMYLEEVKPLPANWQMAMSLAATGRQFCDTLLTMAQTQLGKVDTATLALPDLGPGGS